MMNEPFGGDELKIAVIGGGTGSFTLLSALKDHTDQLAGHASFCRHNSYAFFLNAQQGRNPTPAAARAVRAPRPRLPKKRPAGRRMGAQVRAGRSPARGACLAAPRCPARLQATRPKRPLLKSLIASPISAWLFITNGP